MKKSKTMDTIDAEESDYLFVKTSQIPFSGNGLFTAIQLYPEEVIALFQGELLSNREATKRVKAEQDRYFISMPDGGVLDSMHSQGYAHYANDASAGSKNKTWKNNARIGLDENDHVSLIAISTIPSGSEIFCGYGKKYWRKHGILTE